MEPSIFFVRDSKFSELPRPPPHLLLPQYKLGVQNHALRGSRGGTGGPDPPEILKANELLNGVSLAGRCWPASSGIWILSPLNNIYCQCCRVWPPLNKLSGSAPDAKPAGAFLERVKVCRPDA